MAKILFLTRSFYPNIGGVEKHVLEISHRLIENGHQVSVITEQPQKSYDANYHSKAESAKLIGKAKKIRIVRIQVGSDDWFKKLRVWFELIKYAKLILESDVVHCHDVFYWYLPFRFLFPFKKVFTTFHGYEGNAIPGKKEILMHKIAEKLSYGNICVGDFLKKWYGTKPTFVTYGAIDKKLLEKSVNKSRTSDSNINISANENNKIIFVGRLEKETGIMSYLKALNLLNKKGIKIELDVYGEGALENQVISYLKDQKLKVNMKGFVLNIENVLKNYEYVFCSRYLSILESLVFKQNVFAEYNNAIKKDYLEMAPFAKFISISKNSKEISQALENVLKGKLKLDTKGGYDWIKNQTWENMVNIYLDLWGLS